MILIEKDSEDNKLNDEYIKDKLEELGFNERMSTDEYLLIFDKDLKDSDFDISITLEIYKEDVSDKYSVSISTPDFSDYAYLSDYMETREEFDNWLDSDYGNVIDEILFEIGEI